MTTTESRFEISALQQTPARVGGVRQEVNHLWYGPSKVLVARLLAASAAEPSNDLSQPDDVPVAGAIRLAMRERALRPQGLIADLVVDDALRESGLPEQLIREAEARLKESGAQKIDAVTVDGKGWATYFYRCGYWSSRRMVVLTWDLNRRPAIERSNQFEVRRVDQPDPDRLARFILNSYQPYFRWWKEPAEDQRWDRVELQEEDRQDQFERATERVRRQVIEMIEQAGGDPHHTFFLAYQGDELVGLCDAKNTPEGQDTFDWCVLVSRQWGGKGLGSTLLDHALDWLKACGKSHAEYTSTSGLDDYDPLIYLSTVAAGAQIRGEFLNLIKTRL